MSDQDAPGRADAEGPPLDRTARVMERLLEAADVSRVYGEPIRHGDTTLLPAAEVLAIAGFGLGSGRGTGVDSKGEQRRGSGGGGGGGGRTLARAVAVIVASPEGVRVKPVIDVIKIALAALTAAGFVVASWKSMSRSKRTLRG